MFLIMASRAVAGSVDHGFWSRALLVVGLPAVLLSYAIRLRRRGGAGMVAGGVVFAVTIVAPGALLGSPRWPDVMVEEAVLALGILFLFASGGKRASVAAVVAGSLLFSAALTLAMYA